MISQNQMILESLISSLRKFDSLPEKIDIAQFGKRFWVSAYSKKLKISAINEEVSTGMSDDKYEAILKCLVENIERKAFKNGKQRSYTSCLTPRSDGFAALPVSHPNIRELNNIALYEAIERYAWATWWDDEKIGFNIEGHESIDLTGNQRLFLSQVLEEINVENLVCIVPKILNADNTKVIILFAELRGAGYVSGGACESEEHSPRCFMRALDELYRHGLAYKKMLKNNVSPNSFYEERLEYFASGKGNDLVAKRLASTGLEPILLPELSINEVVPHDLDQIIKVHRCYFKDQPPFMGGTLERLCL